MKKPNKPTTWSFFNYKWKRVPTWARDTEEMYRQWYLTRYGYKTTRGLKQFLKNKNRILEAGCGLARDSKFFAELAPHAGIVAMDQSLPALRVARETIKPYPNCSVVRGDITCFTSPGSFDFISCDQVLHHTPNPGQTLRHLFNKLAPGGILNFSVCRKKNPTRDLIDDLIMERARTMKPRELWKFAETVTMFGKALHDLGIGPVNLDGKKYETLQRLIHNNVFRCWYNLNISFELSASSNYDWFSGNPRFDANEVKTKIMSSISGYIILRFYEDDATISVSLKKGGK